MKIEGCRYVTNTKTMMFGVLKASKHLERQIRQIDSLSLYFLCLEATKYKSVESNYEINLKYVETKKNIILN